jgi:hypothetical protein
MSVAKLSAAKGPDVEQPVKRVRRAARLPASVQPVPVERALPGKEWKDRAIVRLQSAYLFIEAAIPHFPIQDKIDAAALYIKEVFKPLEGFNRWLDTSGRNLAVSLSKLPMRALRNVVLALFNLVKGLATFAVHPARSTKELLELLITLSYELTRPQIWPKVGAGLLGGGLGQAAISANPFALIGSAVVASLILAGVSFSLFTKEDFNLRALPEAFLTGFMLGLVMGGIEKRLVANYQEQIKAEARQFADRFVSDHNLPAYRSVNVAAKESVQIGWNSKFDEIAAAKPGFNFLIKPTRASHLEIELGKQGASYKAQFAGRTVQGPLLGQLERPCLTPMSNVTNAVQKAGTLPSGVVNA